MRVLHLTGSAVSPFMADLSRLYAADCLRVTAEPDRYETFLVHVSPGGWWSFPEGLDENAVAAADPVPFAEAMRQIAALDIDVMVPQMFCLPGMTTYRAVFELLGIPFVGNTPEVMALAAHKARAKSVVAAAGVRVPDGALVRPGEQARVPFPAVVKPVDSDNSLGVALVGEQAEYAEALAAAFEHSAEVLVEEYVELGREVRCGVLEIEGGLVCLPLEEYAVDRETKPIRGYADKLSRDPQGGALSLVAKDAEHAWILDPTDPVTERVWAAARTCHRALGCRDYSLFDFRVDAHGEPWFLEAGLYCSFAEKSVIAVMAAAAGIGVQQLFETALSHAAGRSAAPARSTP